MTCLRLLIFVVVVMSACRESPQRVIGPTGPPVSSLPKPSAFTLSGTVYEHGPFGQRPLAQVPLEISPNGSRQSPEAVSDSDGRYTFTGIPVWEISVQPVAAGYHQLCRAASPFFADLTLDVHLVSDSVLVTSGVPASVPIVDPHVSGQVVDRNSRRPIKAATVIAESAIGPAGTMATLTDSSGRYLLCGLRRDSWLYVLADGYETADASIPADTAATRDFELTPNED